MYKRLLITISSTVFAIYLFLSFKVDSLEANIINTCGNGICQASKGEDTLTCPEDCGPAPTPTPPPPTPQPTIAPTNPPTTAPTNPPTVAPTTNPTTNPATSTPNATNNPNPTPTAGPNSTTTPTTNTNNQTDSRFVRLDSYPSGNINGTVQNFIGSSNLIDQIEYNLNNGDWIIANGTTNFNFSLNNLTDGSYTVKTRGRYGSSYIDGTTVNFTLVNQSPEISFNIPSVPTDNTNFVITGNINSTLPTTVEVSINGGITWLPALINNGVFRSLIPELEDGNYQILVRAIDSLGNITISEARTLIIDTLPPTIGTQFMAHGPLVINPTNNTYQLVAKTSATLYINILGGPTSATVDIDSQKHELKRVGFSNIWSVDLNLTQSGIFDLNLYIEDGANNTLSTTIAKIDIKKSGTLSSSNETTLTVYQKDFESNSWFVWNGATYNQENPKTEIGSYSFVLPKGIYYIDAKSDNYSYMQSEIFDLQQQSIVNFDIEQKELASINLNLPIIGDIVVRSPFNFIPNYIKPTFELITLNEDYVFDFDSYLKILEDDTAFSGLYILSDIWSPIAFDQAQVVNSLADEYKDKIKVYFVQSSEQKIKSFMRRGNYKFNYDFNKDSQIFNNKAINSPTVLLIKNGKIEKIYQGLTNQDDIVVQLSNM